MVCVVCSPPASTPGRWRHIKFSPRIGKFTFVFTTSYREFVIGIPPRPSQFWGGILMPTSMQAAYLDMGGACMRWGVTVIDALFPRG